MKKIFFSVLLISIVWLFTSCNQENSALKDKSNLEVDLSKKEVWAELVESKTPMIKQDGFDDEYWATVSKKVDKQKIFNTIVDAVLSGKKQAYDILTDSVLKIDEVVAILSQSKNTNPEAKKISAENLSMIRIREKWFFDTEKFKLEKQVTRIDLLLKNVSQETGEYIGDKPLFYVNL